MYTHVCIYIYTYILLIVFYHYHCCLDWDRGSPKWGSADSAHSQNMAIRTEYEQETCFKQETNTKQ